MRRLRGVGWGAEAGAEHAGLQGNFSRLPAFPFHPAQPALPCLCKSLFLFLFPLTVPCYSSHFSIFEKNILASALVSTSHQCHHSLLLCLPAPTDG